MRPGPSFATSAEWGAWLARHHADRDEVWITYWKKGSAQASITWQEAVVEALCWGWIDGIRKSLDAERFEQRFTPRRPRSIWSKINRAHAERLIAEGRMQAPGLAAVERAKANGQWDKAYATGMAGRMVPPELAGLLAADKGLAQAWEALDARNRFAFCHRLDQIKTQDRREAKAVQFADMIRAGGRLYP